MVRSNAFLVAKALFAETIGSFLYFPIWWYSLGLLRTGRWCAGVTVGTARSFAIGVWLKNLFVPMYGQRDITGRLVSFFARLVVIAFYSVVLTLVALVMLTLFYAWIAFPVLVVYELFIQRGAIPL